MAEDRTDDRERRLPRRVRDELLRLRADLANAERRLLAFEGGQSRISMGYEEQRRLGLPEGEPVNFAFGAGKTDEIIRVMADFERGELTVRGGDSIGVLPFACNAVVIKLERR